MNANASPRELEIAADADTQPSLLDEKKFLEERRRRLEASLHDHVEELKDKGKQAGQIALVSAGALLGVWLVAKAAGSLMRSSDRKKHRKQRRLKAPVSLSALGPGERSAPRSAQAAFADGRGPSYADAEGEPRAPRPRPASPPPPPEPAGPSLVQTFLESDAGKMMANQLVALLMVFVTRKLESFLQIERDADIGSVKESDLTPYRIVDPVSDATVVPDEADDARPNGSSTPSAAA